MKRKILVGLVSSFVLIASTLLVSQKHAKAEVANNLTTGLELQWKMNEEPGNASLTDTSTNHNTGTLYNTDVFTSRSTDVPYTGGTNSHSLLLNGTDINDYAQSSADVPDAASSTFARTLCGWVKLATTSGDQVAFNYGTQYIGGKFGIYASNGHWWFWGYNSADMETTAATDTEWHHHCVSYDGGNLTYYLDGLSVGSAARSLDTDVSTKLIVGQRDADDFFQPLHGQVDDVRLYSRPLSLLEVRNLANLKSVSVDSKPASRTNTTTGHFTFTTAGTVVMTTCSIDGGPTTSCTSPYVTPPLSEGDHSFTVTATYSDATTNSDTYNWTIDTIHPNAVITQLGPGISSTATTSFVLTAEEPSTFECSLDLASFVNCDSSYTTPSLDDGEHSLVVIATDAAGNGDGTPTVHTWTVDTSQVDSDGDGIINQEGRTAPNGGDANNDGIQDANQANVTSFKTPDAASYVVLSTDCDANSNVGIAAQSSEHTDSGYVYPDGIISFSATGCGPPQCVSCSSLASLLGNVYLSCCPADFDTPGRASVTILVYDKSNTGRQGVRKYNETDHAYSAVTGATIEDQVIDRHDVLKAFYTIDDGSSFDADGAVNDTIVDPVGISYTIPGAPNTGLGKR